MGQRRDEGRNLKNSHKSGSDPDFRAISEKGRGLTARGPSRLPAPLQCGDAGMDSPRPQSDKSMRSVKLRQPRALGAARRHASPLLGGLAVGDEGSHVALGRSVIIVGTGSLQNKLVANLIEQRTGYVCRTRPAESRSADPPADRKSTRLNSSHAPISYAVFCLEIGRASCRERV